MNTELFLENYPVDLSTTLSSLLTLAIDDVKDFGSRQTTFSKAITIPGTSRNNALFGNIFETGISNDYDSSLDNVGYNFNASKSARCLMFQDNLQTFKGTLRLLQIVKDRGTISYDVALNGELTSLVVSLSSGYLTDLDFSAYDQDWNETNVVASWDNPGGSGVYFPLIDYGTFSTLKHDWDIRTMRPALYVKEYLDKMFEAANFRYECALFSTARFQSLVIPHNQKKLLSLVSQILSARETGSHTLINTSSGISSNVLPWDASIAGGFTYASGVFTYTQVASLSIVITASLSGNRISSTGPGTFNVSVRKNGIALSTSTISSSPVLTPWGISFNVSTTLATNDTIDIFFQYNGVGTGMLITAAPITTMTITSNIPSLQPVDYGQTITINDSIPQNIRQVEFFTSIVRLFNLYVYEDRFDEKLIKIAPYVDFFSTDSSNAVDWTYKLDRSQPEKIQPLSEINSKTYGFNYKDDSDYWNDTYKKRYNQGYGSYIYDSEFEFASGANRLDLIFASTPLVGYVGEDKVYSTIYKRTGPDTAPVEENVDSAIRILQSKKVTGVTSWDIMDDAVLLTSVNNYGYAGHFSDPDFPTNDLNFGSLKELFFELAGGSLNNTQFNIYWSAYMAEITDKDSRMLTAKFYLTPRDIFELDFSKYVYVSGELYRLNKITDYNTTTPDTCEVRLLKVVNTIY